MRASRGAKWFMGAALALLVGGAAPSCKPVAGGYCAKVCECSQCDDYQRDQCIDSVKQSRSNAERIGCGGEFDDYLSCTASSLSCDSDGYAPGDPCQAESDALVSCGGSPDFSCAQSYQRMLARYEQCGIFLEGDTGGVYQCPPDATTQLACFADCTEQVPCGALTGEDPAAQTEWAGCVGNCQF